MYAKLFERRGHSNGEMKKWMEGKWKYYKSVLKLAMLKTVTRCWKNGCGVYMNTIIHSVFYQVVGLT